MTEEEFDELKPGMMVKRSFWKYFLLQEESETTDSDGRVFNCLIIPPSYGFDRMALVRFRRNFCEYLHTLKNKK